jgi:hypothetical protein
MSNSAANAAVLTATGMRPGGAATEGTVDIANTGTLGAGFMLERSTPVDSDAGHPLSGKLNVIVDDCGTFVGSTAPACGDGDDVTEYTGTLAAMSSAIDLGNYAGGAKHRYRFRVALDSSATNDYQGDNSSVTFTWNAA